MVKYFHQKRKGEINNVNAKKSKTYVNSSVEACAEKHYAVIRSLTVSTVL